MLPWHPLLRFAVVRTVFVICTCVTMERTPPLRMPSNRWILNLLSRCVDRARITAIQSRRQVNYREQYTKIIKLYKADVNKTTVNSKQRLSSYTKQTSRKLPWIVHKDYQAKHRTQRSASLCNGNYITACYHLQYQHTYSSLCNGNYITGCYHLQYQYTYSSLCNGFELCVH
jgi:hypothetical protein